ncbi:uncharacterized protein EAE97_002551 [Botrytis byssoidea]|uniref:Fe2OG dioxygenase domain-containing protein n=1 Tax=Botrytis byssoidea TaxID=139641 RepID=A0A9P5IXI1_9HELO|nr:uncharacterized protein EAE97_002551 [Botrytis byssoidea]KAF7950999.1 hypothetical protein EAE97_002551 [Botrytis byssoidea]
MPPSSYFKQWPEFPSNVPVAYMSRISFKNLQSNNFNESARMFDACRDQGHFLLDLRDSNNGETLSSEAGSMMDVGRETLDLDRKILDSFMYKPPKRMVGYKPSRTLQTPDGRIDSVEFIAISQDDAVGNKQPFTNPQPVEQDRDNIKSFFEHAHGALDLIHFHLDMSMGLAPGTLEALSSINKTSDTSIRMLCTRPKSVKEEFVTLNNHTDIGSITLLFTVCGGLQVLGAGIENIEANWRYVRPEPGCVIVLIGDTMVAWTAGALRASLHRVVTAPGKQAAATRLGLGYFLRPSHSTKMSRLISDNGTIPMLAPGEVGDERGVTEWAQWKANGDVAAAVKAAGKGK